LAGSGLVDSQRQAQPELVLPPSKDNQTPDRRQIKPQAYNDASKNEPNV
jgi:hypothetical protein